MAASRARPGPTGYDLTEKQWYAVCKFWPNVAKMAKRPVADIGAHNPFDSQVKLGPFVSRVLPIDLEAIAEREAIQYAERELLEIQRRSRRA